MELQNKEIMEYIEANIHKMTHNHFLTFEKNRNLSKHSLASTGLNLVKVYMQDKQTCIHIARNYDQRLLKITECSMVCFAVMPLKLRT